MHYVHISTLYRLTTLMFICQTVNSDRFLETLFCTRSEVCCSSDRFLEYAANSSGGERLRREGETSCLRGETGDIILLNEI